MGVDDNKKNGVSSAKKTNNGPRRKYLDFLMIQYQILSDRRINQSALLWNIPSLLFVGETFLWTLSLDGNVPVLFRCLISAFSLAVGFVSFQTFERARLMEDVDSEQMWRIEKFFMELKVGGKGYHAIKMSNRLDKTTFIDGCESVKDFIGKKEKAERGFSLNRIIMAHPRKIPALKLWKAVFYGCMIISGLLIIYNIHAFIVFGYL